jgi:hypothetical protein
MEGYTLGTMAYKSSFEVYTLLVVSNFLSLPFFVFCELVIMLSYSRSSSQPSDRMLDWTFHLVLSIASLGVSVPIRNRSVTVILNFLCPLDIAFSTRFSHILLTSRKLTWSLPSYKIKYLKDDWNTAEFVSELYLHAGVNEHGRRSAMDFESPTILLLLYIFATNITVDGGRHDNDFSEVHESLQRR